MYFVSSLCYRVLHNQFLGRKNNISDPYTEITVKYHLGL